MIILKTQKEIDIMYEAGQINYACLMEIKKHIGVGVSTLDLDNVARKFLKDAGVKPAFLGYNGYPAHICASINEEVVHGIPSKDRILKEGDIIGVDMGVIWKGYIADSAYTWAVGEVSPAIRKLMEVTNECLKLAIEASVEGNRIGDVSEAVQKKAEAGGYSVVRDLSGHGVGRQMHEDPKVPNFGIAGKGHKLRAGMVYAIEPMVNMGTWEIVVLKDNWTVITKDRKLSAHYEHTVAVTKDGPRILTAPNGIF